MEKVIIKRQSLFILVVCCFVVFGCSKGQKKVEQIKKIEDVSEKGDELSTKAVNDSTFTSSDEYKSEMDRFNAALMRKTSQMDESEKLLVYFESSLRMLKQYTDKEKQNPALTKDKKYMQVTMQWGSQVQQYNQALKRVKLTDNQKKKLDELNAGFSKF